MCLARSCARSRIATPFPILTACKNCLHGHTSEVCSSLPGSRHCKRGGERWERLFDDPTVKMNQPECIPPCRSRRRGDRIPGRGCEAEPEGPSPRGFGRLRCNCALWIVCKSTDTRLLLGACCRLRRPPCQRFCGLGTR